MSRPLAQQRHDLGAAGEEDRVAAQVERREAMLELARPLVVRYYLGQAHYRSVLDYRPTSLTEAAAAVERIETFLHAAIAQVVPDGDPELAATIPDAFGAAMDDDLNIPAALAVLHETVRAGNTALAHRDDAGTLHALAAAVGMTSALGINPLEERWARAGGSAAETAALDVLVSARLADRALARTEKNWAESDRIRHSSAAAGIEIADSAYRIHLDPAPVATRPPPWPAPSPASEARLRGPPPRPVGGPGERGPTMVFAPGGRKLFLTGQHDPVLP